jgi:hypothetical protein
MLNDYADPMIGETDTLRDRVNATVSLLRAVTGMAVDVFNDDETTDAVAWARPASEAPGTRGRLPIILQDGTRVSRAILGCTAAEWADMRANGTARVALYTDDRAAGTACGFVCTEETVSLLTESRDRAIRLVDLVNRADASSSPIGAPLVNKAASAVAAIMARLTANPATATAIAHYRAGNPRAYLSALDGRSNYRRERIGHHQDVSIQKTYRNPTADPSVKYGGRAAESYVAGTATVDESAILAAITTETVTMATWDEDTDTLDSES